MSTSPYSPLKAVVAQRVHAFFMASPFYPADIPAAWEDGKKRLAWSLETDLRELAALTLQDYCRATGANLLDPDSPAHAANPAAA